MTDWLRLFLNVFSITLAVGSDRILPADHPKSAAFVLAAIVYIGLTILWGRAIRRSQENLRALLNRYSRATEDRTRAELQWSPENSKPYVEECRIARELNDRILETR
jgi:hypothetical protein